MRFPKNGISKLWFKVSGLGLHQTVPERKYEENSYTTTCVGRYIFGPVSSYYAKKMTSYLD